MYTDEKFNGRPISMQNIFVTSLEKLKTYIQVTVNKPIRGCYIVWANPETYNYGIECEKYSCMDAHFYEYNKIALESGISVDDLKKLDSIVDTRLNKSFRAGQYNGAQWERKCQKDKNLIPY